MSHIPETTGQAQRPKVLVFCRAYLVDDFQLNFEPLSGEWDFFYLTDGKKDGVKDTREAFYRHFEIDDDRRTLDADQVDDCIARCRLLRNLKRADAERRVHAMAAALSEWFDAIEPELTICHMVDEYVTHIASMLSRGRGIQFIGYAYSYFPGCIQVTSYENGTAFDFREPEQTEVDNAVSVISQAVFRQDYGQRTNYTFQRHIFAVCRYYLKRAVFSLKGILEGDRLNVHYAITPYLAEKRSLLDFPPAKIFHANWKSDIHAMTRKASSSSAIYMALAYFPEATNDYWISNKSIIDYENTTIKIIQALSKQFVVAVKEHPHMLGARRPSFYKRICAIKNTLLIPPLEYSTQVLDKCDAMILGAGSGGVEATLHNKPVFTYSNTSYWFEKSHAFFLDLCDIPSWPAKVDEIIKTTHPLSKDEKNDLIRQCLRSTLISRPGGRRWPLADQSHLSLLLKTAREAKLLSSKPAPTVSR